MKPNHRINLKNNSKLLVRKKDLLSIVSKKLQKLRNETLQQHRLTPCTQTGLQILSNAMSDYYKEEDSKNFPPNECQIHNDSLDSGATDADTIFDQEFLMTSKFENILPALDNSDTTFDENDLIYLLGIDYYHELMFKIEEEIKNEHKETNDYDLNDIDNELIDTLQSEQLICPNCRYVVNLLYEYIFVI